MSTQTSPPACSAREIFGERSISFALTKTAHNFIKGSKSSNRCIESPDMRIIGIIPARYASTRFPGKPLALIAGKSLIQRVVERCQQAKSLAEVVVATDDARIAEAAGKFCRVEMTRADHPSGSDRIAEVALRNQCDAVVNIQ